LFLLLLLLLLLLLQHLKAGLDMSSSMCCKVVK
jgi:hypothetical protein